MLLLFRIHYNLLSNYGHVDHNTNLKTEMPVVEERILNQQKKLQKNTLEQWKKWFTLMSVV